jgi:hypothetical protein
MQLSPPSHHFFRLRSKYPPERPILKNSQSVFLFYVIDQVSHPYRSIDKIIVLFILIFTFWTADGKIKSFWIECWQALPKFSLLLISSWIKFWYVTVVLKYLNCEIFSGHLLAISISRFWPAFWWRASNIYVFLVFSNPLESTKLLNNALSNCRAYLCCGTERFCFLPPILLLLVVID